EGATKLLAKCGYPRLRADDPAGRHLRGASHTLAGVGGVPHPPRRTARWAQLPHSCENVLDQFVRQRLLVSGAEHGERTLSVAHEALFRVWDTLHGWLLQDRKALTLRSQIEEAAAEWGAAGQAESRRWP